MRVPDGTLAPGTWDALLESYLELIQKITEQIESLEAEIEERAGSLRETQFLMTILGMSYFTALTIYAELGEINRFDPAKEVVSYVGLNPITRESGDSRFEGSISKRGSGRVRWLLAQASYSAVHTCEDEYLSRFYNQLARKMNSKTAIVATARKYDPPGVSA